MVKISLPNALCKPDAHIFGGPLSLLLLSNIIYRDINFGFQCGRLMLVMTL